MAGWIFFSRIIAMMDSRVGAGAVNELEGRIGADRRLRYKSDLNGVAAPDPFEISRQGYHCCDDPQRKRRNQMARPRIKN